MKGNRGRQGRRRGAGILVLIAMLLVNLLSVVPTAAAADPVIPDDAMKINGEDAIAGNIGNDPNGQEGSYAWIDHNSADSRITYEITAAEAGTYQFAFRYTAGTVGTAKARTLAVDVNDQVHVDDLTLPDTGTWNTWFTAYETLDLQAGLNTVTLRSEAAQNGMCLDYFHVWETAVEPAPTTRYEAENADINRAIVWESTQASEGKYIGNIDYDDSYVQFNQVHVDTAGTYGVTIGYANGTGADSTHNLVINDTPAGTVTYPATGGWMNTTPYNDFGQKKTINVELQAGDNTIRLVKGTGYAEVDYIDLIGSVPKVSVQAVSIPTPSSNRIFVGETLRLSAVVTPDNASKKQVLWTAANSDESTEARATIDAYGVLTSLAAGDVTVTATSVDNPAATASVTITIANVDPFVVDLSDRYRPVTHAASGALYGLAEEGRPTDDLIAPLKPRMFTQMAPSGGQLPNGEVSPIGDALKVASIAERNGASVTIRMPDIYPDFPYKWVSWDDWYAKVDQMVNARLTSGASNIYAYELWNEPDWTWDTTKAGAYLDGWKKTYDRVRSLDPDTPIMGPSYSIYVESWLRDFLSYCKTNNCLPDIISWHELGDFSGTPNPQNIESRIANYRAIEQELGIDPLPISINEYMAYSEDTIPGNTIQYIAQFERGGVDTANTAFWFRPGRLSNIVTDTGKRNGSWWMFKWYGDMTGKMAMTTPPQPSSMGLDGIASVDTSSSNVQVIFGGADGDRDIVVRGFDSDGLAYTGGKAYVTVESTPWYGVDTEVKAPTAVYSGEFDIVDGQIIVPMTDMNPISAYHIVITPAQATANTRYESEHATTNKAGIFASEHASNVKYVGQIDFADSYIEYTVNAAAAGTYNLTIGYANGMDTVSTHELSVNGKAAGTVSYAPTGGWTWSGKTGVASVQVTLTAGANTIRLTKGETGGYAEQDYIQLTPVTAYEQRFEAEQATITDAQVFTGSYASDFRYVGYINNSDSSLLFQPIVPTAGQYTLEIGYANGTETTSSHTLTINGTDSVVQYAPTGGWVNAYANKGNRKTVTLDVNLIEGENSIKLTKMDGYAELDYIKLTAAAAPVDNGGNNGGEDGGNNGGGNGNGGGGTTGSGGTLVAAAPSSSNTVGTNGVVTAKSTVDAAGAASAVFEADSLSEAIQQAASGKLTLKIDGADKAGKVSITIPAAPLRDAGKGLTDVTIEVNGVTVVVDASLLTQTSDAKNIVLMVSTKSASELPDSVRDVVGDATVYDFSLTLDGNRIADFGQHGVTVSVPYELKQGEDPHNVVIVYLTDSGDYEVVTNGWYDEKTGTVTFQPKHFSLYAAIYVDASFNDLGAEQWATTAVEALAAREIVKGDGKGAFRPNDSITRAEFVQMVVQAFGLSNDQASASFSDVNKDDWFYASVAAAEQYGIVTGRADGTFGASSNISRQDMALILYRVAKLVGTPLNTGEPSSFSDASAIAGYAADAVEAMYQSGIVHGMGNGSFEPGAQATRAQAAMMIYNLLQLT
ncbi:carbohydrate binding protein with CBM6 domain [Paenibacillus cellulosilyticus]|uniref:Carbohydrate binding protein with CBM6 domain n=1 Tax=Paenibacillus cellulosilyticus TaxID=375489 RepID=A0A2V2YPX0_9BACL|nr:S-layer homology domain-containing protein [Paenibacillus cellulosilyticus]PWV98539.1 carbohydrate binding protein with CBM6 domain [Paenibacillus cellulosilyticus]QKS44145.1 S-layer homology domain-containing protein [Paenibacillus cellulosilyticus]